MMKTYKKLLLLFSLLLFPFQVKAEPRLQNLDVIWLYWDLVEAQTELNQCQDNQTILLAVIEAYKQREAYIKKICGKKCSKF